MKKVVVSHQVTMFTSAFLLLNGNPTSNHVYTIIKNNRNATYDTILNAFDIKNTSLDVDCSFDPNVSSFTTCKDKFDLLLTFEEWKQIEIIETIINRIL